jgi:Fur family zinc uptake transcriptional regulator
MLNKEFSRICINKGITLTPLRQDVLEVMLASKPPLTAYEILDKLKQKRPNAEPPTVYRVLEFLIREKVIHRIESKNTYVCCSHLAEVDQLHSTIIFFCNICRNCFEYADKLIAKNLKKLIDNNRLSVESSVIEMQGTCSNCLTAEH